MGDKSSRRYGLQSGLQYDSRGKGTTTIHATWFCFYTKKDTRCGGTVAMVDATTMETTTASYSYQNRRYFFYAYSTVFFKEETTKFVGEASYI